MGQNHKSREWVDCADRQLSVCISLTAASLFSWLYGRRAFLNTCSFAGIYIILKCDAMKCPISLLTKVKGKLLCWNSTSVHYHSLTLYLTSLCLCFVICKRWCLELPQWFVEKPQVNICIFENCMHTYTHIYMCVYMYLTHTHIGALREFRIVPGTINPKKLHYFII